MYRLVLLRHGQSVWNQENRFTGWKDVSLSEQGRCEAQAAGQLLHDSGFHFDVAYTSVLKRAIRTLWYVLEEMDQMWIPVHRSWHLNERHYGALQGLNKSETAQEHGEEQVRIWRRSYSTPPPLLSQEDPRHPCHDERYHLLKPEELPSGEALLQTAERVLPFWQQNISQNIRQGQNVLITAHGNSLRALIQHLDGLSEEEIMKVNVPTGTPLIYELDEDLKTIKSYYLGDPEKVAQAMGEVVSQGKA